MFQILQQKVPDVFGSNYISVWKSKLVTENPPYSFYKLINEVYNTASDHHVPT